jgi:hypothetical protein
VNRSTVALLALLGACTGPAALPPPAREAPPRAAAVEPRPEPPPEGRTVASNAGTYRVVYRTDPAEVPRGEPFDLSLWVLDADGRRLAAEHAVAVDAGMPQHRHGMNVRPRVAPRDDGGFDATGLLFHMSGAWTLTFDVEVDGVVERAQTVVELE